MCIECICAPTCNCREQCYDKRLLTKPEKTEKLKNYAEELKKELTAVEESIEELGG